MLAAGPSLVLQPLTCHPAWRLWSGEVRDWGTTATAAGAVAVPALLIWDPAFCFGHWLCLWCTGFT